MANFTQTRVRVVKLDSCHFEIEYKDGLWVEWKTVDKVFKKKSKANEYIEKHFANSVSE